MREVRQVNLGDVPEAIREAVLAEARERDVSFSVLITEVVARCYGVAVVVSGQRLRNSAGGELRVVRIPEVLAQRLARAQQANGGRRVSKARLILNCLAEHYGLPPESPLNRSLAQPRGEGGRFRGRG